MAGKPLGRLLVRKGKTAGLFIPYPDGLKPGLYHIEEAMGEVSLKYVGEPYTDEARLNGLDLNGLMSDRPSSIMTEEELRSSGQLD